jgi:hypothetical protein
MAAVINDVNAILEAPRSVGVYWDTTAVRGDDDADWSRLLGQPKTNRAKRRRLPSSAQTMADGSPLRIPKGEGEADVDGDPLQGRFGALDTAADRVRGLVQGGHGFKTERVESQTPIIMDCRFCGASLRPVLGEWFCEFGPDGSGTAYEVCEIQSVPVQECRCNWCLTRDQWLANQYRTVGQPAMKCKAIECRRAHDRERQQRKRAKDRAAKGGSRTPQAGVSQVCPKGGRVRKYIPPIVTTGHRLEWVADRQWRIAS